MSDWQEFEHLELENQWISALSIIDKMTALPGTNPEPFVRGIYLCHNAMLEENPSVVVTQILEGKLREYFVKSKSIFENDHEYLFFTGKILYIAEWLFGLDDDMKPIPDRLAFTMQKKASVIKPGCKLYEWAWRFSLGESDSSTRLANNILFDEPNTMDWLKKKGFPGQYIIQSLEYSANTQKIL